MLRNKQHILSLLNFAKYSYQKALQNSKVNFSDFRSFRLLHCSQLLICCLVLLSALQNSRSALAEPLRTPSELQNSVFLIKGDSPKSACGTGLLLEQKYLISNAHLVENLCPQNDCSNLSAWISAGFELPANSKVAVEKFTLRLKLRALDLAVIEISPELPSGSYFRFNRRAWQDMKLDMPAEMYGFPGCRQLIQSRGLLQQVQALHLFSTLEGRHGSSGSPISLADGSLLGIADEADSFLAALFSKLFRTNFALRGIQASHLAYLLEHIGENKKLLLYESELLLAHYQTRISPLSGLLRLLKGVEFQFYVRELLADYQYLQGDANFSSLLGVHPEKTLSIDGHFPDEPEISLILSLILLANIEQHGISDFETLHKLVFNSPFLREQNKRQILQALLAESPAGMNRFLMGLASLTVAILLFVLIMINRVRKQRKQKN